MRLYLATRALTPPAAAGHNEPHDGIQPLNAFAIGFERKNQPNANPESIFIVKRTLLTVLPFLCTEVLAVRCLGTRHFQ